MKETSDMQTGKGPGAWRSWTALTDPKAVSQGQFSGLVLVVAGLKP